MPIPSKRGTKKSKRRIKRVRTEDEALELIQICERFVAENHPEKEKIKLQVKELKERFKLE